MQYKVKFSVINCFIFIILFSCQTIDSSSDKKHSAQDYPTDHNRVDAKKQKTDNSTGANYLPDQDLKAANNIIAINKISNQEIIESLEKTNLPKELNSLIVSYLKNSWVLTVSKDIFKSFKSLDKDHECTIMTAKDNVIVINLNDKNSVLPLPITAVFQNDEAMEFPPVKAPCEDIKIKTISIAISNSRKLFAFALTAEYSAKNPLAKFDIAHRISICNNNVHNIAYFDSKTPISCIKFSPDDKYLAMSNKGHTLTLFNLSDIGELPRIEEKDHCFANLNNIFSDISFFNNIVVVARTYSFDNNNLNFYGFLLEPNRTISTPIGLLKYWIPVSILTNNFDRTAINFKFSANCKYAYIQRPNDTRSHYNIISKIKIDKAKTGLENYTFDFSLPIYCVIQSNSNIDFKKVLNTISFSKNNKFFAFYKYFEQKHIISILDLQLEKITQEIEHPNPVLALEFSNDSELVVLDSNGYTRYKIIE